MRVGDHQTEIRVADLRFTPLEAAAFLRACMGLDLQDQEVRALADRTEGWIAGQQSAALAVQGDERPQEFVDRFTGSHRFVLDRLTEALAVAEPEGCVRIFLDEGPAMVKLMEVCGHRYAARLVGVGPAPARMGSSTWPKRRPTGSGRCWC